MWSIGFLAGAIAAVVVSSECLMVESLREERRLHLILHMAFQSKVERDLQGFGFLLHLPLMLGLLKAGADNNSKAVAISQRVPDWSTSFCCELRQTKLRKHPKVLLSPSQAVVL